MARGISAKLPLARDYEDGIALNKSIKDSIKQNLKNLILTSPGERIMDPNFGVGLNRFVFENDLGTLRGELTARINSQINRYMPFIRIQNLSFESSLENDYLDKNFLQIRVFYFIEAIGSLDFIDVETTATL